MDLGYFLNQRLSFIEYFHDSTTNLFNEVKRKIEAGEAPYVDASNSEDAEEPAFLEEWQQADDAVGIAGAACLEMLQATLHVFLDSYMDQIGKADIIDQLKRMGQGSWLGNYRAFFSEYLAINWLNSGADLNLIEQVILTRNDFTHNIELHSIDAYQTPFHAGKYPNSAFADPEWKTIFSRKVRLAVSWQNLSDAIAAVRSLCEFLENERGPLLGRWRA